MNDTSDPKPRASCKMLVLSFPYLFSPRSPFIASIDRASHTISTNKSSRTVPSVKRNIATEIARAI